MKEVRNKAEDLADYLNYRKAQIAMHKDKYSAEMLPIKVPKYLNQIW
jgi:hypothetical protein